MLSARRVLFYQSLRLLPGVLTVGSLLVFAKIYPVILGVIILLAYGSGKGGTRSTRWGRQEAAARVGEIKEIVQELSSKAGVASPNCRECETRSIARYDAIDDAIEVSAKWFKLYDESPGAATGVLAHELGHCIQKGRWAATTDVFLWVVVFYLGVTCVVVTPGLVPRAVVVTAGVLAWVTGSIVARFASRQLETDADVFARKLGYGPVLAQWIETRTAPKKLLLFRSHPTHARRVATLDG